MSERIIIDSNSFSKGIVPGKSATPQYAPEGFASFGYGVTLKRMQGTSYLTAIQPQEGFSDITDFSTARITNRPVSFSIDSSGEVHAALLNARVVNFGVGDNTIATGDYYDIPAPSSTITRAYDTLQYSNATDEYTLVSFTYAAGASWAIARKTKSTGSWTNNWTGALTLSNDSGDSALSSGTLVRPYMWQGPDGFIYICNGRWVAQHNPTLTTMNLAALNVGIGYRTISGTSYGNYSAIVSYKVTSGTSSYGSVRVTLWNGYDPAANFVYEINDNQATAIYNNDGRLLVFTNGRNGTYKVWELSGSRFTLIHESSYLASPASQENIDYVDGALLWTNDGNYLNELRGNAVFSRGFRNATYGAIKNLTGGSVYVGYQGGASYKIATLNNSDYYADGAITNGSTYIVTRIISLPLKSTIRRVRAIFANYVAGAKCEIFIGKGIAHPITNPSATCTFSDTTYTNLATSKAETATITIPDVTNFTVGIRFNHSVADTTKAVALERVEIEYEPTSKP